MRIVVDNQNASHNGLSCRIYASNFTCPTNSTIDCAVVFTAANQCVIPISAPTREAVCPPRCIGTIVQLIVLAQSNGWGHLAPIIRQAKKRG
jgi:hypothetical protein